MGGMGVVPVQQDKRGADEIKKSLESSSE